MYMINISRILVGEDVFDTYLQSSGDLLAMVDITFDAFLENTHVQNFVIRYDQELPLYRAAALKIYNDVNNYNQTQGFFSAIQCRIKSKNSLFFKMYSDLKENYSGEAKIPDVSIQSAYDDIKDVVGLRAACQYLSDIKSTSNKVFKNFLVKEQGYRYPHENLSKDPSQFQEKDYTNRHEEETGYRGFHLYLEIPTEIDIFGKSRRWPICEIQIRTELQHIWASRSHDLVYKPQEEVLPRNREDMKQIGHQIGAADYFLDRLKDDLMR